jgi:protein tyrosine phosphatase
VVKQFQLTGWKELRLPEDARLLLNFVYFYREQVKLAKLQNEEWEDAPIVVHCSAGVGRTGVFIAIDRVFSQLSKQKNEFIDLYGIIVEMRRNRPFMVQTEVSDKLCLDIKSIVIS